MQVKQAEYMTQGGYQTYTNFSGSAILNDVLIWSGAGRLNTLIQHTQMLSGQSIFFYDAAIATSGGPFAASGHKIVAIVPSTYAAGVVSGVPPVPWGVPARFDVPFQSGLCAATRSGTPGFTAAFTPEVLI